MYVRWKKRARTRQHRPTGEYTLTAVLVRNDRINFGPRQPRRPRQEFIKHLGSIHESEIANLHLCRRFWTGVEAALNSIEKPYVRITPDIRAKIEASIQQVVPRPTDEDIQKAWEASQQERDRLYALYRESVNTQRSA